MNEKDMPKADFITGIVLLAFSIGIVVESLRMPLLENLRINPYTVPGIVPGFLGVIIGFLSLVLLVRAIVRGGYRLELTRKGTAAFFGKESTRRTMLSIVVALVYALIFLGRIPYLLATVIFIFAFIVLFEYREAKKAGKIGRMLLVDGAIALIAGLAVSFVFQYLFLVKLP